jgi:hypothetical protein
MDRFHDVPVMHAYLTAPIECRSGRQAPYRIPALKVVKLAGAAQGRDEAIRGDVLRQLLLAHKLHLWIDGRIRDRLAHPWRQLISRLHTHAPPYGLRGLAGQSTDYATKRARNTICFVHNSHQEHAQDRPWPPFWGSERT